MAFVIASVVHNREHVRASIVNPALHMVALNWWLKWFLGGLMARLILVTEKGVSK